MSKNELKVGKLESTEAKPTMAPRSYGKPELVVLGQAFHLVQGDDYTKTIMETDGSYFEPH